MLYTAQIEPTTPMKMIIRALSASTRSCPPNAVTGPSSRTRMARVMPIPAAIRHGAGADQAVAVFQPNAATNRRRRPR